MQSNIDFKYYPNDYETIGKPLGKGVFGETWLIRNKKDNTTLVMKRIPKDKTTLEMLENEVNVLKHVKNICGPHLLCYVGVKNDPKDDSYTILTEYLGGYTTLEDYIKKTPDDEKRWRSAPTLFANLILAINDLHRAKVAHRDVKPSNLLFDPLNKNIKIIDMGLACYAEECDDPTGNKRAGTISYMSPEIGFESYSVPLNFPSYKKADIWAVAITMLEYIIGEEKFERLLQEDSHVSVPQLLAAVPRNFKIQYPDIMESLNNMLRVDPQQRQMGRIFFH